MTARSSPPRATSSTLLDSTKMFPENLFNDSLYGITGSSYDGPLSQRNFPPPVAPPLMNAFQLPRQIQVYSQLENIAASANKRNSPPLATDFAPWYTIRIKGLHSKITENELETMFLFSEDFLRAEITPPSPQTENGEHEVTAYAIFRTQKSALEAQARLDGKVLRPFPGTLVVELVPGSIPTRRGNSDIPDSSVLSTSNSSSNSDGWPSQIIRSFPYSTNRQRTPPENGYTTASQQLPNSNMPDFGMSNISSNNGLHENNGFSNGLPMDTIGSEMSRLNLGSLEPNYEYRLQNFSPSNDEEVHQRNTRMNLVNDLSPPDTSGFMNSRPRRSTNPPVSTSRYRGLAPLTTSASGLGALSMNGTMQSTPGPMTAMTPGSNMMSPVFYNSPTTGPRIFPACNPHDQNPPCNTLYVGNLPGDTNEDELKALFSRQKGYKRLCFRTKATGHMCFVEFEDVTSSTKALLELYGRGLSNSTKGGIRLSFSKNPLGVRSTVPNGVATPNAVTSPTGATPNGSISAPPGFATAMHNPPGLSLPPSRQQQQQQQSSHQPAPHQQVPQQQAPHQQQSTDQYYYNGGNIPGHLMGR